MPSSSIARMPEVPGVPARIAGHLGDLIMRGELAPGERVAEARITSSLGVSRGSVREALQLLSQQHLVELQPRRGAVVTDITEQDTRDLYEMLITLYTALAQRCAQRWRTGQELEGMRELVPELEARAARGDVLAIIDVSAAFTDIACELAGSRYLARSLHDLRAVFNRSYYRALASDQVEFSLVSGFITDLVELVACRDLEGIVSAVRDYGEHQRDQVLNTF